MVHNALTPKYYFFLQNHCEKYLCESKSSHIVFSPFSSGFWSSSANIHILWIALFNPIYLYKLFWKGDIFRLWNETPFSHPPGLFATHQITHIPADDMPNTLTLGKLDYFLGMLSLLLLLQVLWLRVHSFSPSLPLPLLLFLFHLPPLLI